jgi:RNA polymerase sigma factor (sigma-70 family)
MTATMKPADLAKNAALESDTDRIEAAQRTPPPTPQNDADATSDVALVSAARNGDMRAYDQLIQRYQSRLYSTIYHMTSNHEDANDLAQETFIKAHSALKSFKGDSSFYTWVYRIAVNKTINFLKQRKSRQSMSLNDLDFNVENDPDLVALVSDKTPRRDLALVELQEKLNGAMQKLSEVHRLVVTLHDVQDLSHEEIADIMECNVGTVRSRLYYARQQLQAYLSDYIK